MLGWIRDGHGPTRLCHNCSGKHAAKLVTCVTAGWDTASYLDAGHPLQLGIIEQIERLGSAPITATSVDGCGAPAHALPAHGSGPARSGRWPRPVRALPKRASPRRCARTPSSSAGPAAR